MIYVQTPGAAADLTSFNEVVAQCFQRSSKSSIAQNLEYETSPPASSVPYSFVL